MVNLDLEIGGPTPAAAADRPGRDTIAALPGKKPRCQGCPTRRRRSRGARPAAGRTGRPGGNNHRVGCGRGSKHSELAF